MWQAAGAAPAALVRWQKKASLRTGAAGLCRPKCLQRGLCGALAVTIQYACNPPPLPCRARTSGPRRQSRATAGCAAAAEQAARVCPALPQHRAQIRNLSSQQVLVLRQPLAHLSGHERGACRNSGAATQNLAHQPSAAAVSTLRDHKNAEESPNQCKWLAKSVFQWPALTAKK